MSITCPSKYRYFFQNEVFLTSLCRNLTSAQTGSPCSWDRAQKLLCPVAKADCQKLCALCIVPLVDRGTKVEILKVLQPITLACISLRHDGRPCIWSIRCSPSSVSCSSDIGTSRGPVLSHVSLQFIASCGC